MNSIFNKSFSGFDASSVRSSWGSRPVVVQGVDDDGREYNRYIGEVKALSGSVIASNAGKFIAYGEQGERLGVFGSAESAEARVRESFGE